MHTLTHAYIHELYSTKTTIFYENGLLHRDGDEPAIIWTHGLRKWYKHGILCRDGGKPPIEFDAGELNRWWQPGLTEPKE